MDSSGNRAILVLLAAVVVLAGLVTVFGYPLLISLAVLASFAALGFLVVLSLGDFGGKPSRASARPETERRPEATKA